MRFDLRRLCLAAAGLICLAGPSIADDAAGRYELSASRDGFVRLDTATGAVSHCRSTKGVWRCEPLATDNARVDGLATDVAKLKASLAVLDARIAALAVPGKTASAPAVTAPVIAAQPADEGPSVMQQTLAKLFDLVRVLKHGRAAAT